MLHQKIGANPISDMNDTYPDLSIYSCKYSSLFFGIQAHIK